MNTHNKDTESGHVEAAARASTKAVQLHIIHDLGGGSATWLRDFCLADTERTNIVLKSYTQNNAMGCGISLYLDVRDETPQQMWHFNDAIQATVTTHAEYRSALEEIIERYGVQALLISSVIGHSLDALNTELPTAVVNHDYFPYCPAINIHFGEICTRCDAQRVAQCYEGNPKFNPFITFLPAERIDVRESFLRFISRPNVTLVAPSQSVETNLVRLNPRFRDVSFATIPHGYWNNLTRVETPALSTTDRLRILVLGQISVPKGLELLRGSLASLLAFADVYLVGCRELGGTFKFESGVHIVADYEINQLPGHVAAINAHVALLMSVVPETFSYALTELMALGMPVAATRVGSFPERIQHGQNGFLYEPNSHALLAMMRSIDGDRNQLAAIRENLRMWKPRTAREMVAEYHRILPLYAATGVAAKTTTTTTISSGKMMPDQQPKADAHTVQNQIVQSVTISSMWKELKSLNLQLATINQARHELDQARQQLARQLEEERKSTHHLRQQVDDVLRQLAESHRELTESRQRIDLLDGRVAELLNSTSWKLTLPMRVLVHFFRKLKILARTLGQLLRKPSALPENIAGLFRMWRSGGTLALKTGLLSVDNGAIATNDWQKYRGTFCEKVKPEIVRRMSGMAVKPQISILVPTYNTPEIMLQEMLDSVQAQLYPNWELCIADDGSALPHVKRVLEKYASADSRIKLHFEQTNRGVSYASNRALELVTSDFVVLLDHDDLLEEQALFRFAESILQDNPDMVYSDEVLVSPDAATVLHYAYRPAFSPEFLRSHPYIVHLIGFRTQLLREIGGFDENLHISHDYDLILRATEKSETIVHIPELLYQWRVHVSSAGHQKMHEVMEVSKSVLRHHLTRCGANAEVNDGPVFNFFDVRYPLDTGLRVAIIIPTKNHGELLRQCIQSIRATVLEVKYDIVVIDHESDEVDTLTYLSSITSDVRVLRYVGIFNFSAINNWAVSNLGTEHSHYLFCNNDIEAVHPGWLERMLELGQQPTAGIVGAKLFYPDRKTVQHAGVCVGMYGAAEHYGKFMRMPSDRVESGYSGGLVINHEVSAVTGACLLMARRVFEKVGGYDENILVGFGDVDLCLRTGKLGYRVLFCPYAELVHHESYTRGKSAGDAHAEDSALFGQKWKTMLEAGDPYFNPGLSSTSTCWQYTNPIPCRADIRRRVYTRDAATGLQEISI